MKFIDKFFKSSNQLLEKGNDYLFGLKGQSVNIPLAYQYFCLAAKKGNKTAAWILANYYTPDKAELCEEFKQNFEDLRQLRLAVEAGDPSACYLYGIGKLNDETDDYIYRKGFSWIKYSAEAGFVPAMHAYGCELLKGKRVPKNRSLGLMYVNKSAEQGFMDSVMYLYEFEDKDKALEYANKLAKQDNGDAVNFLAHAKLRDKAYPEAIELFERAAQLGNREAMFNTAMIYDNGEYCERNPYKAAKWYQKAA